MSIDTNSCTSRDIISLAVSAGHQNRYYWIGAIQAVDAKGAFQWTNGARFYSGLWFSGEPNQVNRVNRLCVDLGVSGQQYKMNDWPCASSLPFLCEKGKR